MTSPTRVKVENPAKKLSNYRTPAHSSPHILSQSIHEGKAEDQVLATKVQQVQPTQQDLVADDLAAQEEAQCDHTAQQDEDLAVHEEAAPRNIIAHSGGDNFPAYNGGTTTIHSEEYMLTAEVEEAIMATDDSHEYKHVDKQDAVPDETVTVQAKDHYRDHQAYQDPNQEEQLGIRAKETLNSKKTSTRPGTARPAPRTGTKKHNQGRAQSNQNKFWSRKTDSTISKATSRTTCKKEDIETVSSVTKEEQHSQEKVKQQEDVHKRAKLMADMSRSRRVMPCNTSDKGAA
jgi:hypothetical protein